MFSTGCRSPKPSWSELAMQREGHGLSVPECACQVSPWGGGTDGANGRGPATGDAGPSTVKLPQPPEHDRATQVKVPRDTGTLLGKSAGCHLPRHPKQKGRDEGRLHKETAVDNGSP